MAFIAVDNNISNKTIAEIAHWGYDLIIARHGEPDRDFIDRALYYPTIAFLSKDTDIATLLDYEGCNLPVGNSSKQLKRLLFGKKSKIKRSIKDFK